MLIFVNHKLSFDVNAISWDGFSKYAFLTYIKYEQKNFLRKNKKYTKTNTK